MHSSPMPILQLENVTLSYDGIHRTLQNLNLNMHAGEFLSLIGPSGCGKSTLLNLIAGFLEPSEGRLMLDGAQIVGPGPERGVVFQDLALFPWLTVMENVVFGLKLRGVDREERLERGRSILEMVGLQGKESSLIADLSGGMKQRVAIARTLVTEPKLLLLDEPFSALDAQTRETLQEELMAIQAQTQMTILLVTHSIDEAVYLSDRVIVMRQGTGEIIDELDIELRRPRLPEVRVSTPYNLHKKHLMQALRHGYAGHGENYGSGI